MGKFITSLLTAGFIAAAAIPASSAEVIDQGNFFSAPALKSANQTISELERKYKHQIHVETYATAPGSQADAVAKMSKSEQNAFFVSWLKEREKATKSNGLFVLITKTPSHVHAGVNESLVRQGFTSQSRERVVNALLEGFRGKNYDEGLQHALTQVRTEFSKLGPANASARTGSTAVKPLPNANRQPSSFPRAEREPAPAGRPAEGQYGGLMMIGLLVVGGLILFSVVSRMFSRSMGGPGMGGTPGMGGGGFGSGLMGGLFGAMAGNWLYNSFGGHHNQAFGGDQHTGLGDNSSGGDYGGGDFSGGSDFGGGDFGSGGDYGGGDF